MEKIKFYGLGECNHRVICSECILRRRILYNQFECPVCR